MLNLNFPFLEFGDIKKYKNLNSKNKVLNCIEEENQNDFHNYNDDKIEIYNNLNENEIEIKTQSEIIFNKNENLSARGDENIIIQIKNNNKNLSPNIFSVNNNDVFNQNYLSNEFNNLEEVILKIEIKKKKKGLKKDKEIYLDFQEIMNSRLIEDLKSKIDINKYTHLQLMMKKFINENVK